VPNPLLDWFANRRKVEPIVHSQPERETADGLWTKCANCSEISYNKDFTTNHMVCTACGHHHRIDSDDRLKQLIDPGTWSAYDENIAPIDALKFKDRKPYQDRLRETQEKTGLTDAVLTGCGQMEGLPVTLGIMDFRFMGGSMGSVVGEKLTRAIERATDAGMPVIIICASGGARMQEGMLSLMQMAKISGALERHARHRLLYIPVLTHPTTGGVIASFAMLGDLILAEPKATIGFAGRRVIEQTVREKLPEGFQTSEYLLQHGFVDKIVPRPQLKATIAQLVRLHQPHRHSNAIAIPPTFHSSDLERVLPV
jgi:acetyl-CoA carboxylase carboxyl transferase subunit beta